MVLRFKCQLGILMVQDHLAVFKAVVDLVLLGAKAAAVPGEVHLAGAEVEQAAVILVEDDVDLRANAQGFQLREAVAYAVHGEAAQGIAPLGGFLSAAGQEAQQQAQGGAQQNAGAGAGQQGGAQQQPEDVEFEEVK